MHGFIDNNRFRKLLLALPEKAIEILYEQYYHVLVSLAESLTHDRKASEDIVQETFIHVWEQHRKLGQPESRSFGYYLVRVVRNKAITWYKEQLRRGRYRSELTGLLAFAAGVESAESRMIGIEMVHEIRGIIVTFPRREMECLLMRIDEELTPQQIADRLSISRKAVERSLTSGSKRLRKFLRNRGYGVDRKKRR